MMGNAFLPPQLGHLRGVLASNGRAPLSQSGTQASFCQHHLYTPHQLFGAL
jgi:hypothetical protein